VAVNKVYAVWGTMTYYLFTLTSIHFLFNTTLASCSLRALRGGEAKVGVTGTSQDSTDTRDARRRSYTVASAADLSSNSPRRGSNVTERRRHSSESSRESASPLAMTAPINPIPWMELQNRTIKFTVGTTEAAGSGAVSHDGPLTVEDVE
jgi:hypothetical protein